MATTQSKTETRSNPLYKSAANVASHIGRGINMLIDQHIREPERLRQEADLSDQEYRRGIESWSKQQPALPGTRDENRLPMAEEQRELSPTQQSSWGPESEQLTKQPTIQQGLENIISASRTARQKMADAARYQTGLEHIDIPGTGVTAGQAAATAVNIINPLPSSKTDVALAAIPFATIFGRGSTRIMRMLDNDDIANGAAQVLQEHANTNLAPRVMRMVTRANKEGFEHMDHVQRGKWMDEYLVRAIGTPDGKWHPAQKGELHWDAAKRMRKEGIQFPENVQLGDEPAGYILGGDEVIPYEMGNEIEAYIDELMVYRGR